MSDLYTYFKIYSEPYYKHFSFGSINNMDIDARLTACTRKTKKSN